jgi:RNA polymerase sigma-70 factor (ECF subfamily)
MTDDSALLQAAKNLAKDELTAIFDTYAPAIYKYALRLCHDPIEADNIVGDVFSLLLEQFVAGKGPVTNLRSYLYQIAYHLIVDHVRYSHRVTALETITDAHDKLGAASARFEDEDRILTEKLVSSLYKDLSDIQRHVIILRFLENFSLRETATYLGKNVSNVKVIQSRGIAKLRMILDFKVENRQLKLTSNFDRGLSR